MYYIFYCNKFTIDCKLVEVSFLFPPCESWGQAAGHQAWHQAPSPAQPS